MTKKWQNIDGNDSTSQPRSDFLNQIRERVDLDSSDGYTVQDLDCIIRNYKTKKYLMIETKCYLRSMTLSQKQLLEQMYSDLYASPDFVGVYLLQFENLGPSDGYCVLSKYNGSYWEKADPGDSIKMSGDTVYSYLSWVLRQTTNFANERKSNEIYN